MKHELKTIKIVCDICKNSEVFPAYGNWDLPRGWEHRASSRSRYKPIHVCPACIEREQNETEST